jgi:phosphatidylglycerophosphate synthase
MADQTRRPLKSRDTALAQRIARRLAVSSVTPNQISAVSIVFAALAGLAFWLSASVGDPARTLCLIFAALGIQARLLCNLFDGMVAIEGGRKSPTGAFWNEFPDRVSDILILVGMGLGAGSAALGWAVAALAVLAAYVREMGSTGGHSPDFSGPMAKPHRMAAATLAALLQILAAWIVPAWDILEIALWILLAGTVLTVVRRSRTLLRRLGSGQI